MSSFTADPALEQALRLTRTRAIAAPQLLRALLDATLIVPSATAPGGPGGLRPLLFRRRGLRLVGVFSDQARIGTLAQDAPYRVPLRGIELLRGLPPQFGLVLNPWSEVDLDIAPEGIPRILADFDLG